MKEPGVGDILAKVDRELAERRSKRLRAPFWSPPPRRALAERKLRRVRNAERTRSRELQRSRRRHGRPVGR